MPACSTPAACLDLDCTPEMAAPDEQPVFRPAPRIRGSLHPVLVWSFLALAGSFAAGHSHGLGIPCLFRLTLGLPCPGCGMTRSLSALWRGDPALAFRYHPLGPLMFVLCALLLVAGLWQTLQPSPTSPLARIERVIDHTRVPLALLILVVAVWVVRLAMYVCGSHYFLW